MPSVSNSAPPQFRAKQRTPVKPQRAMPPGPGPTTPGSRPQINRSPMTMGGGPQTNAVPRAGVSSMVAPPPRGRMMAEGGFGSPDAIGGMPPQKMGQQMGQQAPPDMDPGMGGGDMDVVITPESVNFHDQDHDCSGCKYMGHDGMCAVLKIEVGPESGCNAWSAAMEDESQGREPGEDDNDTGMGTSGMMGQ